jgi:hypothetical protein
MIGGSHRQQPPCRLLPRCTPSGDAILGDAVAALVSGFPRPRRRMVRIEAGQPFNVARRHYAHTRRRLRNPLGMLRTIPARLLVVFAAAATATAP